MHLPPHLKYPDTITKLIEKLSDNLKSYLKYIGYVVYDIII